MNMRFLDYIIESEGITNRKEGDIFTDEHNNFYKFKGILRKPGDKKEFLSTDEMDKDIAKEITLIEKEYGKDRRVIENNVKHPTDKSYMLLLLIDEKTNKPLVLIRYFNRPMSNQLRWTSSSLKKKEIELKLYKQGTSKSNVISGLVKVSDIYGDTKMSSKEIIKQTESAYTQTKDPNKKEIIGALNVLLNDIHNGGTTNYTLKGMKKFENVFDVSLSEAVVPMALIDIAKGKNKSLFSSESLSNLENCIGEPYSSFKNLKAFIPKKANERLVDSVIYDGDDKLFGISNKAGKGAAASITNIIDGLAKIQKDDPKQYKALMKKYPNELIILKIINDNTSTTGIVLAAKQLELINDKESIQALEAIKNHNTDNINQKLLKIMSYVSSNTNLPRYDKGLHLLTALAKEFSRKINADSKYIDLIKRVLISSKFVQASPKFITKGDDLVLDNIKLIWPPIVKSLTVDYNKNYTATQIRGKLSFKVH